MRSRRPHADPAALLLLSLLLLLFVFSACSSDDDPVSADPTIDQGIIPTPTGPQDILPDYTVFEAEEIASLSRFEPTLTGGSAFFRGYEDVPIYDFRIKPEKVTLWESGRVVERPDFSLQYSKNGGMSWSDMSEESDSESSFFHTVSEYGHGYYISKEKVKWSVAQGIASQLGADLVVIESQQENDLIEAWLDYYGYGEAWIGLTDFDSEGNWVWTNDSSGSAHYRNWDSGEPNNHDDNEHFACIRDNGNWNDEDDGKEYRMILEWPHPVSYSQPAVRQYGFEGSRFPIFDNLAVDEEPFLARTHLWRKVFQHTVEWPGTYSQAHSVRHGLSETRGTEFCLSVGITLSYSYGGFTGEFNTTFSSTFSRSVTVTADTSVTKTYSTESIEGKAIHLSVWQQVEQFLVTDENAEVWSDLRYATAPLGIQNGLNNEYQRTVMFDNP